MIMFYYEIAPFNSMISGSLSLWHVVDGQQGMVHQFEACSGVNKFSP